VRRESGQQPISSGDPVLDHHRELQRARQGRVAKLLFALFLVVVFILFIIQNSDPTPIKYVFFTRHTRLIWIMLACGILGGIIGYLVGRPGKQVHLTKGSKERDKQRDQKR
jgi:uncharacterized integral membrane protein